MDLPGIELAELLHACPHMLSQTWEPKHILQHSLSDSCNLKEDELLSGMINSVDSLSLSVAENQDCMDFLRPQSRPQMQILTQEIQRQRRGVDMYPIQAGKASSALYQ